MIERCAGEGDEMTKKKSLWRVARGDEQQKRTGRVFQHAWVHGYYSTCPPKVSSGKDRT